MTATNHEINDAKQEGVLFNTFKSPVEIVDEGIILADTKKITNEDGSTSLLQLKVVKNYMNVILF